MADRRPLIHESSDLDSSSNTPALPASQTFGLSHISPPTSPPASRPNFPSFQSDATAVDRDIGDYAGQDVGDSSGLGIDAPMSTIKTARKVSIQAVPTTIVDSRSSRNSQVKSPDALSPPGSAGPYYSGNFSRVSTTENTPDLSRDRTSPGVGTFEEFQRGILRNARSSSNSYNNDYQNYLASSDTDRLREPSIKSAYERDDFRPIHECPTAKDFYQSRFTWLNITVIVICVFSCVFSGIFLGLALKGPRYGRRITSQGHFKPADAILLTSIIAKLIEISFVTSFVAFLGQVLSRRAFMKEDGRGVTLSELSMWRWVVQPGTLILHWQMVMYAGITVLGILSLVSAVLATLYSSAAVALVQPILKNGNWDNMIMTGRVKTDFANVNYIKDLCQTPIRTDDEYGGSTCLQIEHAGQGYHNYQKYLAYWDVAAKEGNGTTKQLERPPGFGLLYENTTVTPQWINIIDTKEVSKQHGRVINNVSLAMPHSGVLSAARDQKNDIMQPEELNSEGTYSIRASVLSPVLNVICANMDADELKPIIYEEWTGRPLNVSEWPAGDATTKNKTKVDDIFGWNDGTAINSPPVFGKLPKPFNTIMNHTSNGWGRPAIYLLGQGGRPDSGPDATGTYAVCKIEMAITPECTTRYNATGSGGTMEALCESRADNMELLKHHPEAKWILKIPNWRDIGFDWSNSLSLNTGIVDGAASNSRLLMQLILNPTNSDPKNLEVDLNPALPSMGEALAVMSGCTLLKSMLDAPFATTWEHKEPLLDNFETVTFNASITAQQYASGGVDDASKAWLVVLILVFLMNMFVLIYFIVHRGLVTDFCEPPNLFALAVNSPPSHDMAGSCGGGPEGKQLRVKWFVQHEGNSHIFMEPGEKTALLAAQRQQAQAQSHTHSPPAPMSPAQSAPKSNFFASTFGAVKRGLGIKDTPPTKLSSATAVESLRTPSLHTSTSRFSMTGSEYEMEDGYTRSQRQYAKLANRRSML